jgi:hypothetical protein
VPFSDPADCYPVVLEAPLAIPKGLPGVLEPLAGARLGGVFRSNRLPVLHEVLATLSVSALVSLLPALSEHPGACQPGERLKGWRGYLYSRAGQRLPAE